MFSYTNSELKYGNESGDVKITKLDIPVMIGKRFLRVFRVNAGPVFSIKLNQSIKSTADEISSNYKNTTVGLQYGIGIDVSKISIDLRVEKGLQSISNDLKIAGETFATDQRLNQVMLALGYRF